MPEVARRAGVGQATLYRHFPDRYALASAVVTHQLERLEATAAALPDHAQALRCLLREVLRAQVAMRPLVHLVLGLAPGARNAYQRRVVAALAGPLRRAQERGQVRADLVPDDVVVLLSMIQGMVQSTVPANVERRIDLRLDAVFRPARG